METTKITFLAAGSTVFAKNVLGDCMLTPSLAQAEYALFDIDLVLEVHLGEDMRMVNAPFPQQRVGFIDHVAVAADIAAARGVYGLL